MTELPAVVALVVAAVNGAAGLLGAWRWWRVEPSRAFWVLCRAGQVAAAVQAAVAGVLAATGFHPDDGLYWLYALLPLAVSFVAEQLRVTAAQTVLDARDLEDAQAVGTLDDAAQRSVVLAIVRREMGTMAASCLVVAFLALRAAGTA
ncbi:MAG: hypothetical protein QOJ82_2572 [Solirubrobacteraceae bacterium]|jgi:uncharacterized protein YciI|nr:hypothetical protein [Solirubrobacteraceae bacterium]